MDSSENSCLSSLSSVTNLTLCDITKGRFLELPTGKTTITKFSPFKGVDWRVRETCNHWKTLVQEAWLFTMLQLLSYSIEN